MPIKNLTLGLCLLFAGQALAQSSTHIVRRGETLSALASRYHTTTGAIIKANGLKSQHQLAVGRKLVIPSKVATKTTHSPAGVHVVASGQSDWKIAKRYGITATKLKDLNPGVDMRHLQVGQKLRVPGGHAEKTVASARFTSSTGGYVVREGDNDWIIARRLGTSPSKLREFNPGVDWTRIQVGQTLRTPSSLPVVAKTSPAKLNSTYAVVTHNGTIVRAGAASSSKKLVTVGAGTQVKVLGHQGGWYKLKFPHGTMGWVRGDLLAASKAPVAKKPTKTKVASSRNQRSSSKSGGYQLVANNSASAESLLRTAQSFRGVRYRYGGMSRSGTDCSGFTTQVFSRSGVKLPRTSRAQATVGTAVSGKNLAPGDLVFFKTTRGSRISHVGIYVGNGKFIHASSGGGKVQVDSLKSGYYSRRFATARRVVKGSSAKSVAKEATEAYEEAVQSESAPEQAVENTASTPAQGLDQVGQ